MVSASDATAHGRRIRLGMVGGGEGAFIGAVHRIAARLDDQYELVAGALSSTPDKSLRSGAVLGLDPARIYPDFAAMAVAEAARPDGIEAVSIVTPNHAHFAAASAFLNAGIHVICDKPMTTTLADAKNLAALVNHSGRIFCLTHNYTGYPMVRQARAGSVRQPACFWPVDSRRVVSQSCAYSTCTTRIVPISPAATMARACRTIG
jgi:predicted dehydrogenase